MDVWEYFSCLGSAEFQEVKGFLDMSFVGRI